ncbi:hypothetical protein Tco_1377552 [Tanacetum coccineum]
MPPKRTSTSVKPPVHNFRCSSQNMINDGISLALKAQAAAMATSGQFQYDHNDPEKFLFSHSKCAEEDRVTFATGTLIDDALSWWNAHAQRL